MSEEEILVAQLAATSQGFMNHLTRGAKDGDFNANRTDWRKFLQQGGRRPNNYPPNYPPPNNYPPNYPQNYPQGNPIPSIAGDYGDIPSEVPSQVNQLPMPRDAQGNIIIPPELAHLIPNNQHQPPQQTNGLSVGGFDIPNYGGTSTANSANSITGDKADMIIKEIKLLKRAINTLTNLVKKSILEDVIVESPKETSQPTVLSENKD